VHDHSRSSSPLRLRRRRRRRRRRRIRRPRSWLAAAPRGLLGEWAYLLEDLVFGLQLHALGPRLGTGLGHGGGRILSPPGRLGERCDSGVIHEGYTVGNTRQPARSVLTRATSQLMLCECRGRRFMQGGRWEGCKGVRGAVGTEVDSRETRCPCGDRRRRRRLDCRAVEQRELTCCVREGGL